jgi:hypothetical protein
MDYKVSNIVRIGSNEKLENYVYTIVCRMAPSVYNKKEHQCIILQFRESLQDFVELMVKRMRWCGIYVESRKRKPITQDNGYVLEDAWEYKLKKVPVLEMMDEDIEDSNG